MQGKDPLPSGSQSPFSNAEPPPPLPDYIPAGFPTNDPDVPEDWLDPELDPTARQARGLPMPESPLIPKQVIQPTLNGSAVADFLAQGLVVLGRLGAWKGREVQLSAGEEAKIREVVLLAIRRELDADLEQVAQKRPRRSRIAQAASAVPTTPSEPKKRGRPRGSLLGPKT